MRGAAAGAGGGAGAVDRQEGGPGPGLCPGGRPGRPDRPCASPGRTMAQLQSFSISIMFQESGPTRKMFHKQWGLSSLLRGVQLATLTLGLLTRVAARLEGSLYCWNTDQSQSCCEASCLQTVSEQAGCSSRDDEAGLARPGCFGRLLAAGCAAATHVGAAASAKPRHNRLPVQTASCIYTACEYYMHYLADKACLKVFSDDTIVQPQNCTVWPVGQYPCIATRQQSQRPEQQCCMRSRLVRSSSAPPGPAQVGDVEVMHQQLGCMVKRVSPLEKTCLH